MRKREREHVSIQSIGSALHQVLVPDIHELSHCSRYLKPQEVLAVGYCWMLYQFPFFIRALSFKQEIPPSERLITVPFSIRRKLFGILAVKFPSATSRSTESNRKLRLNRDETSHIVFQCNDR